MKIDKSETLFAEVINSTQCPFAKKGIIEYGSIWHGSLCLDEQIAVWGSELEIFVEKTINQNLDGFVVSGCGPQTPKTLEELSKFVCAVLSRLTQMSSGIPLKKRDIEQAEWQFLYKSTRMFLVVMSSIYDTTNSRYSPIPESVSLLFQPEKSFSNFMPHSEFDPRTVHLKGVIRRDFVTAGKVYDIAIVTNSLEAIKYVKPLYVGDEPIIWWKNL